MIYILQVGQNELAVRVLTNAGAPPVFIRLITSTAACRPGKTKLIYICKILTIR